MVEDNEVFFDLGCYVAICLHCNFTMLFLTCFKRRMQNVLAMSPTQFLII